MLNITRKYLKNTIKLSIDNRLYTSSTKPLTTTITQQSFNNNIFDNQDLFDQDEIDEQNEQEILEYNERILKNKLEFESGLSIEKEKLGKLDLESKQFKFEPKEYTNFQPHTTIHIGDKNNFAIIRKDTDAMLFEPYIRYYNEKNETTSHNKFRLRWKNYGMDLKEYDFLPHCELTALFDWKKKECHLFLLNLCSRIMDFKSLDGWYYVDNYLLEKFGIDSISAQYKSGLVEMLMSVYPYHNWDIERFSKKDYLLLFYYNELIVEKYLKQYGYLSKIDKLPSVRLQPNKPHLPFQINQHIKSKFIGYNKVTLQNVCRKVLTSENRSHDIDKNRSKYMLKNHLQSLYKMDGSKGGSGGPFDLEKLYNIDFKNNSPYTIDGSTTKTINFISSLDSSILPWKFKYQSNDSEMANSRLMIDYIKERFNLVNPEDWYNLEYTEELVSILPEHWHYKISFLSYLTERYPIAEFTFDPKKFKDARLFSHLFESRQVLRIREVLDRYAQEKGLVITKKQDWLDFQIEDPEFHENVIQYSQYKILKDILPFVYPREDFHQKIIVTDQRSLELAVKSLVKRLNLSMDDLYDFDFQQHIYSASIMEKLFYLPKFFPHHPWVYYRFMNGHRLSLFVKFPNMDVETRRKYSLQFFNYTMDTGLIVHPLDFLSLADRNEYYKHQVKELFESKDYQWILKEYYGMDLNILVEQKFGLVPFKELKRIYSIYLGKNDEDFHLSSKGLMFSELKKSFTKKIKKNKINKL